MHFFLLISGSEYFELNSALFQCSSLKSGGSFWVNNHKNDNTKLGIPQHIFVFFFFIKCFCLFTKHEVYVCMLFYALQTMGFPWWQSHNFIINNRWTKQMLEREKNGRGKEKKTKLYKQKICLLSNGANPNRQQKNIEMISYSVLKVDISRFWINIIIFDSRIAERIREVNKRTNSEYSIDQNMAAFYCFACLNGLASRMITLSWRVWCHCLIQWQECKMFLTRS